MKRLSIFFAVILGLGSIIFLPLDIQRSLHRFIIYFVLSFSMYFLYKTTLILPLGQCLFLALGSYCTVILQTYGWVLGIILAFILSVFMFYVLKNLDPMYFSLGSLCFMLMGQELSRILYDITGGADGIFRSFENGMAKGLLLGVLLTLSLLGYYTKEIKGRLYYQAELIKSGRTYAEAFGISFESVGAKVFVAMSVGVSILGISNALTEGYIVPASVFNPSLTVIPLAVALISHKLTDILTYLLLLLGIQEFLAHMGWGIQGMVLGGILMFLGYKLMSQEED